MLFAPFIYMIPSSSPSVLLHANRTSSGYHGKGKPLAYMPEKKKYAFGLSELKHLGHVVSKHDLKINPSKFKVIQESPQPNTLGEL